MYTDAKIKHFFAQFLMTIQKSKCKDQIALEPNNQITKFTNPSKAFLLTLSATCVQAVYSKKLRAKRLGAQQAGYAVVRAQRG